MVYEHEIPSGSRLYFGKSAQIKRDIESKCANILENKGFSEISIPLFSYHQQESFNDSKVLIRINDSANHEVSLRADSTVDVVRIVTKRLNRSHETKKWFYIQPIFTYPTKEQNQVGAEVIGGTLDEVANIALELLKNLNLNATFQVANIAIAHILVENYGFELDDIKNIRLEKILNSKYEWIKDLVELDKIEDLKDLSIYPEDIKLELEKIANISNKIDSKNIIISPLYYAPMRYYNSLVFRVFNSNELYLTGGIYTIKSINGAGFALNIDAIISNKIQRD